MSAMSDTLVLDVADEATSGIDEGVFVVTVERRRPGSVLTEVVRILEDRIGEVDFESPLRRSSTSALRPSRPGRT